MLHTNRQIPNISEGDDLAFTLKCDPQIIYCGVVQQVINSQVLLTVRSVCSILDRTVSPYMSQLGIVDGANMMITFDDLLTYKVIE